MRSEIQRVRPAARVVGVPSEYSEYALSCERSGVLGGGGGILSVGTSAMPDVFEFRDDRSFLRAYCEAGRKRGAGVSSRSG